jgi:glucose/arabinose dehydrogenase
VKRIVYTAVTLAIVIAACGDDDSGGQATTTRETTAPDTSTGTTTGPGDNLDDQFGAPEVIATGLEVPWGVAFLPDGSALVAERMSGRILRVDPEGGEPEEVMRIEDAEPLGEGGLLGLAVSPDYEDDELVYAYYTTSEDNRIARFQLGEEPEVIVDGLDASAVHDGGRIAFGPDGYLYATVGDAGSGENSQDPDSLNGKILRMEPDGSPAPDNPDPDSLVYTLGHRNPQGLAWDADDRLYAPEFGQNAYDEVNLIEAGNNYGWPQVEGEGPTDGGRFTNPLVIWRTSESSPSGAAIAGDTLYVAGLGGRRLWQIPLDGSGGLGEPVSLLDGVYGRLRTVAVAPDGALWLTTSNRDGRGEPVESDDRIIRFPALD